MTGKLGRRENWNDGKIGTEGKLERRKKLNCPIGNAAPPDAIIAGNEWWMTARWGVGGGVAAVSSSGIIIIIERNTIIRAAKY